MKKRLMCFLLSAVLLIGSSLTVSAAPQKMKDGTIFDPKYYAEQNPDVVAAMGKGTKALYKHYLNYGKAEGRKATADSTEDFDAVFYAKTYPDVVAVYGTDAAALYRHYVEFGRAEGRKPSAGSTGDSAFDAAFYARTYPDVVAVYGTDAAALYRHYVEYGKAEGRKPCADNKSSGVTTTTAASTSSSAAAAAPQETPKPEETQKPQETLKPEETQQPQGPTENIPSTDQTPPASDNANAQKIQDGSFAYFEDRGATQALEALNNSTYAYLTVQGDENDATSFKNMLDSFQWIKECNRLRELNGLEPLLVNDTLMAMAQADANYSDTVIGHAKQFNVGENCAWNYGSKNPFIQWYDDEKAIYDQMENPGWTSETGHYLNIINSSYRTTGFAINTRGTKYPYTYVQVFSYGEEGITVEEYEKIVTEYYNSLTSNETTNSSEN